MENLQTQFAETKTKTGGRVTQAKGIVREQVGNLTHDKAAQLAGKKDQLLGRLQARYGSSWVVRRRRWVLLGAVFAAASVFIAFLLSRHNEVLPPATAESTGDDAP